MNSETLNLDYSTATTQLLTTVHDIFDTPVMRAFHTTMRGEACLLIYLWMRHQPVQPGELREFMSVSSARIAALLNALEKKGYLIRTPASDDRRKILVSLTDAGVALANTFTDDVKNSTADMLAQLGAQDTTEFLRILNRILQISTTLCISGGNP